MKYCFYDDRPVFVDAGVLNLPINYAVLKHKIKPI